MRGFASRRVAVAVVIAVLVSFLANDVFADASARPPSATPVTNLIVGLDVADLQTVNAEVAVDEGFFARQHLNVTFVNLQSSAAVTALEEGSIQIGELDPATLLRAYNAGYNLKMLNGGVRTAFDIVALNTTKCSTWKSPFPGPLGCLVGHVVGTTSLGDNDQVLGEYLIGQAPGCVGGGAKCVTWVADTNPLLWLPALAAGNVQAQLGSAASLSIYAANHLKVWTVANAQLAPNATGNAGKLVPLNVTDIPVASAGQLNINPSAYQGFCQALANANAWLANAKNLKRAAQITQNWVGNGTSIATATAEVKAQSATNLLHVNPAQWRGSERIYPAITPQPYKNVDWTPCDRIKPRSS